MEEVKIALRHWDGSKHYYNAEKHTYINHRGMEKVYYKVINRVYTGDPWTASIISTGFFGYIYYPSDIKEVK